MKKRPRLNIKAKPLRKLTYKQRKFAEFYVQFNEDWYRAYKRAGFKGTNGSQYYAKQLLENEGIKAYIDELRGLTVDTEDLEGLTVKQMLFFMYYCQHHDKVRAYKEAGFKGKDEYAHIYAAQVMEHPKVKAALTNIIKKRVHFLALTEGDILLELSKIIMFDLRDIYDDSGDLLPMSEWDDDAAAVVSSITTLPKKFNGEFTETLSVRKWDKMKAIELYGKFLSMWKENIQWRGELNVHRTGVLEVPGMAKSLEEWEKFAKLQDKLAPLAPDGIIDITPKEIG